MAALRFAPPIDAAYWLNVPASLTLAGLRGRVVVLETFQMLCPGCVAYGLPQAARVAETFRPEDVAVIGMHSVFEHHEAQGSRAALEAFLHEYRIGFPVAVDAPRPGGGLPSTMAAYGMQGTPTTTLIDRQGRLRKQKFGVESDLALGAAVMALVQEAHVPDNTLRAQTKYDPAGDCASGACPAPHDAD